MGYALGRAQRHVSFLFLVDPFFFVLFGWCGGFIFLEMRLF